jgi:hypothetical protein
MPASLSAIGGAAKETYVPLRRVLTAFKSTLASPGTIPSTYLVTSFPILTIRTMHFAACLSRLPRSGLTTSVRPSGGWSIRRYRAP